jgi:hypothetical protein
MIEAFIIETYICDQLWCKCDALLSKTSHNIKISTKRVLAINHNMYCEKMGSHEKKKWCKRWEKMVCMNEFAKCYNFF